MDAILAAARNKAGVAGWRNWGRSIIPQRFCRLLPSSSLTSRPLLASILCVTQPILGLCNAYCSNSFSSRQQSNRQDGAAKEGFFHKRRQPSKLRTLSLASLSLASLSVTGLSPDLVRR